MACDPGFPPAKPICTVVPHSNDYGNANQMGMTYYSSIEDAQLCAASTDRKIFVLFTGYNSMAVPGMEWEIVKTDRNRRLITDQYVLVVLYIDDKDSLSFPEIVKTSGDEMITVYTVGQKNSALEMHRCNANSQPLYAIFDTSLNLVEQLHYTKDPEELEFMLRRAIDK